MSKFNNDKKFDIDLAYGQLHETAVAEMLEDKKVEVKTERGMWVKTGNIAIEYESWGKPSGIASTEADYWFHRLAIGDEVFATLVFEVDTLRRIIDNLDVYKTMRGGDHLASKMYLVSLAKLFSKDVHKQYKALLDEDKE